MLTTEELKEVEKYNTLTDDEKKEYLEKNGVIILEMTEEEDGYSKWTMEMKEEYHTAIMSSKKEDETFDDAFSRMLMQFVDKEKKNEKN